MISQLAAGAGLALVGSLANLVIQKTGVGWILLLTSYLHWSVVALLHNYPLFA